MTPNGERIWGYCRASTVSQVESPEIQKDLIRAYVKTKGLGTLDGIFTDAATSGTIGLPDRPFGRVLVANLKRGDHVIVAKFDRAFRRVADAAVAAENFERIGVSFHVCDFMGGEVDLRTPHGKFFLHILVACAELERSFIRQRMQDGLDHNKRVGRSWVKDARLGFKKVKRGKHNYIVPDPKELAMLEHLWRCRRKKMRLEQIEESLREKGLMNRSGAVPKKALYARYDRMAEELIKQGLIKIEGMPDVGDGDEEGSEPGDDGPPGED